MKAYFFSLNVSYRECQQLYLQGNHTVVVTAESGERVQLPSLNLRPHIQSDGIKGRYRLLVDDSKKVKSFEKIV